MVNTLVIKETDMEFLRIGKDRLFLEIGRGIGFFRLYDLINVLILINRK